MIATFLIDFRTRQNSFKDAEAFTLHRRGIKAMVDLRGGLDRLGLDGMTKCSVLQYVEKIEPAPVSAIRGLVLQTD